MKFACFFFAASAAVWGAPLKVGEFRAEVAAHLRRVGWLAFR